MDNTEILTRLKALPGVAEPNEIQRTILQSNSKQIVIIAPTGTGKTLAYGIEILKNLSAKNAGLQALVIAPSRELVMQIGSVLRQLASGYKTVELYGGHSFIDETASLNPMPQIVVATPGRLLDHLQRQTLIISRPPRISVLDEYDKSLQLGFEGEMKKIFRHIGQSQSLVLTSATELNPLPDYLGLKQPEIIIAKPEKQEGKLDIIRIESFSKDKIETLLSLLRSLPSSEKSIVFVNHRESAGRIYSRLKAEGLSVGLYHGALDQQQRIMAIDLFSNGTTPILVATDLAARGLDIEAVGSVIHYHLPVDRQAWIHRNGRTARQDASGTAYVITSEADTISDYITFNRSTQPSAQSENTGKSSVGSIYFAAGKKEKISRGDIAGFILSNSDLPPDKLGKISVHDHFALAAVPSTLLKSLIHSLSPIKIKGRRVKITPIYP